MSAAPTSSPSRNQPIDSRRHSDFTFPHAGVCRKLAERRERLKSRWSSVVMLATDRTGCDGEDTARGYRSRSEPLAQPPEVGRLLLDPAGHLPDHRRLRAPAPNRTPTRPAPTAPPLVVP